MCVTLESVQTLKSVQTPHAGIAKKTVEAVRLSEGTTWTLLKPLESIPPHHSIQ